MIPFQAYDILKWLINLFAFNIFDDLKLTYFFIILLIIFTIVHKLH